MFWLIGVVVAWVLVGVVVQMAFGRPDQTLWMRLKAIPYSAFDWQSIKGVAMWPVTLWKRWTVKKV